MFISNSLRVVLLLLCFGIAVHNCDKNGNPAITTTDPEPKPNEVTLHAGYKGVMSGSDAKITFADSSQTHGNVTFRVTTDLALTYSVSHDTVTFYAATIPAYIGILTATQLSIYLPAGTTLLGTLSATVPEFGILTGTYRQYGSNVDENYRFFREDAVDSAYFYRYGSSTPQRAVYTVSGDTITITSGSGPAVTCYLSTDKNAFWSAGDEMTYVKDTTLKPWTISVLNGVIPKSEYKYQDYEGTASIHSVTYGIGFGTDSSGNNYYYAYKWSSEGGGGNVYEESGTYIFNKANNKITFKVDSKGCSDGSGGIEYCLLSGGTATLSASRENVKVMISGSIRDFRRS